MPEEEPHPEDEKGLSETSIPEDLQKDEADSNDAAPREEQSPAELSSVPFDVGGELFITDEALSGIAQHAIDQTDGIGIISKQPTGILSRFTRQKPGTPQLRLRSKTEKTVTFDVDVWVGYGLPITEVCEKLQQIVDGELYRITGMRGIVNIRVRGLV